MQSFTAKTKMCLNCFHIITQGLIQTDLWGTVYYLNQLCQVEMGTASLGEKQEAKAVSVIIRICSDRHETAAYFLPIKENYQASHDKMISRPVSNLVKGVVRRFFPEFPNHILVLSVC